jgi:hypothetical protein
VVNQGLLRPINKSAWSLRWPEKGRIAIFPLPAVSPSPGTENEASVAVSYRTGVHRVELGEAHNIDLGQLDSVGEYEPIDCLTARRRRQGSLVVVIGPLGRQQSVGIDGGIGGNWRALFRRHRRHDLVEHCIGLARSDEHADDREPTGRGGVEEMRLHGEDLVTDEVLARMMKVELCQRVAAVTHVERITFREVELDRVSVVDDCVRPLAPTDIKRR